MIGTLAACLTTTAFLPQVIKVMKTKDTSGISLLMYIMQTVGIGLWAIHGFMIKDSALLIANIVTLLLALIILVYKIRYK